MPVYLRQQVKRGLFVQGIWRLESTLRVDIIHSRKPQRAILSSAGVVAVDTGLWVLYQRLGIHAHTNVLLRLGCFFAWLAFSMA